MGNQAKPEYDPIYGETIKNVSFEGRCLTSAQCDFLHDRYHWILKYHDREKSFRVISFDFQIQCFSVIGSVNKLEVCAFSVEDRYYPFILFPCSNSYFFNAVKKINAYINQFHNSPLSDSVLIPKPMVMSVIVDTEARINWVFEIL